MKIAYFTVPGYGHIYPVIPLLQKLQANGHQLTVFASQQFVPLLQQAHVTARYQFYPDSFFDFFNNSSIDLQIAADIYSETKNYLPELLRYLQGNTQDLLLHDSFAPWAKYASTLMNLPGITYAVVPIYSTSTLLSPRAWPTVAQHVFSKPLHNMRNLGTAYKEYRSLYKSYDIKPLGFFDVIKNTENRNIIASHPRLQPQVKGQAEYGFVRPEFYCKPDSEVASRLQTSKPVIYISLGTIFNANSTLLERLVTKLRELDALIFVGADSNYGALKKYQSKNCHIYEHAPQLQILQRADLFVTHAGFNSANQALMTSTPMICIPQAADQFLTASIIHELGCGICFKPSPKVQAIALAAQLLLGDTQYKNRTLAIGKELAHLPTIKEFVDSLEQGELLGTTDWQRTNRSTYKPQPTQHSLS